MRFWATHRDLLLLGAILVLAAALRLVNIGAEPYWADEILSLDIATAFDGPATMLRYLAQVEFHPPLYYLVLRAWTGWFGAAEASTRALSLLFSLGTVALAFVIGRRLFGGVAGLAAAAVVAVLPIQIEYGQEARPYAIFCFFTTLALLAFIMATRNQHRDPRTRLVWASVYVLAAAVAWYLHYSALFGLTALALWWLGEALSVPKDRRPRAFLEWLVVHSALFLLAYPWVVPFLYKILLGRFTFLDEARHTLPFRNAELLTRIPDQIVWTVKTQTISVIDLFAKALGLGALLWYGAVVGIRRAEANVAAESRAVRLLLWCVAVTIVLYALSPQAIPYTSIFVRHAIFASVPFALLLGWVLANLPLKPRLLLAALFLASLVGPVAAILDDDAKWDHDHRVREAGEYIAEHYRPGDLVVVSVTSVRSDLSHYLPDEVPVAVFMPVQYYGHDVWSTRRTLGLLENEAQVRIKRPSDADIRLKFDRLVKLHDPDRIWLYAFGSADLSVQEWFKDAGWRQAFKSVGGLFRVDLYVRPPQP